MVTSPVDGQELWCFGCFPIGRRRVIGFCLAFDFARGERRLKFPSVESPPRPRKPHALEAAGGLAQLVIDCSLCGFSTATRFHQASIAQW